jgi:transcription factor C subunit 3
MTEASHQMCSNTFESRIPGTVGVGVGVEVSIRDESGMIFLFGLRAFPCLIERFRPGKEVERGQIGEVCVKGANVTKGRLKAFLSLLQVDERTF